MAFYELRQYKVTPGKMNAWLKIMEEEIIPFQVSKGMVICGSFRGETDDSVYVWIRRFESEALAYAGRAWQLPNRPKRRPVLETLLGPADTTQEARRCQSG